ncbi:uncharacterized protein BKA55DRAFT_685409 [Fusarium redolens]|uniref:Uncharacterized protein n=1 Tax=Fusarium redolens TaxID=48865 RepID=A0A9P9HWH8_FUSRE|nr:uncharacterized protein BKA55DRAFT_685409 [Fusarium redolens]KAH7264925.1 hypothetical protein BKA55DRAFT_685409 [Fusarium redolens]
MLTRSIQIRLPTGAPLCETHFQSYMLNYITKQIEVKQQSTTTSKTQSGPTRVQPRRVAKDKHPLGKITKKRGADEDLSKSTTKKRKTNYPVHNSKAWSSFITLEKQQVKEKKDATEDKEFSCPFGPTPWACKECISETADSTEENLLFMGEPTAPQANMAPVGRPPKLNIWKDFGTAEFEMSQGEGLSYVIDACRQPMFMFL